MRNSACMSAVRSFRGFVHVSDGVVHAPVRGEAPGESPHLTTDAEPGAQVGDSTRP